MFYTLPEWQFVLSHGDFAVHRRQGVPELPRAGSQSALATGLPRKATGERTTIANTLRQQSEISKREKLQQARGYVMDLNPAATDDFLREHGYATFIHDHTHHPPRLTIIWLMELHVERWVLARLARGIAANT